MIHLDRSGSMITKFDYLNEVSYATLTYTNPAPPGLGPAVHDLPTNYD